MASIRKRGGKWQVQVRRDGSSRVSRTFRFKKNAERWARLQEDLLDRHELVGSPYTLKQVTLGDILARYRAEVTPAKKSVRQEKGRLSRLIRHPISKVRLDQLQPRHVAAFRDERLNQVGSQTVRHDINVLGHTITVAMRDWGVPLSSNPVDRIAKPSQSRCRDRRVSVSEYEQLERKASEPKRPTYLSPLIRRAVETGMRKAELLGLLWANLNEQSSTILLPETKNGHSREVPLSPSALCAIGQQAGDSLDFVFPVSVSALRYQWSRLLSDCQINGLHFHDLRHEAISRLFEKGLSIAEVSLISGHRDPRQLFRYVHPRPADVARKLAL